jgi:hypothetical protein
MTNARGIVKKFEEEELDEMEEETTQETTQETTTMQKTGSETAEGTMQNTTEEALHEDDTTLLETTSETAEETLQDDITSTQDTTLAALEKERDLKVMEAARAMLDLRLVATTMPENPTADDLTVSRMWKNTEERIEKMRELTEANDMDDQVKEDAIKKLEREAIQILQDGATEMEAIMKKAEDDAREEVRDAAIKEIAQFDRMLVPNLAGHLNDDFEGRLASLAPLLRPRELNPHAAIISLLIGATEIGNTYLKTKQNFKREVEALLPHKWHVYSKELNIEMALKKSRTVHTMRQDRLDELTIHQQKCWDTYVERMATQTFAEAMGLVLKAEHEMSICPAWPFRLVLSGTDEEREEQYRLRFGSRMKGGERFVELGLSERGAVVDESKLEEGQATRYDTLTMLSGDPMNHTLALTDEMMETGG